MTSVSHIINRINFTSNELVLENNHHFECELATTSEFNGSLVIDIYVLDNPVHPEGHIGWWQFPINPITKTVHGTITMVNGEIKCTLNACDPITTWINTDGIHADRFIINAVLRNNITNAIIFLDKIPAFTYAADANQYRASFNRDWATPKFASPTYIFPKKSTIRIVSRNIFTRDAIGNLCLDIYRMLRQNNIAVELYCHHTDLSLNDFIHNIDQLNIDTQGCDQLLYFYSIYDPNLKKILRIPFKQRIAYFHGITQPELLQVFDPELSVACLRGLAQIKYLQEFDILAANSYACATTLVSKFNNAHTIDAKSVTIIPPKLLTSTAHTQHTSSTNTSNTSNTTKMLYVGRIKNHKKIDHLLSLFLEYQKLEPNTELWLIGNNSDKAYRDYLDWMQQIQLQLPSDKIHWVGSISDDELHQHYANATVYVSMSEDEGFCLPILEAMLANLPVFAYALPAIREVMQDTGILFTEKDFSYLAKQLHTLLSNPINVTEIIARQRERADQLAIQMDGRGFLKLLSAITLM